MLSKHLRARWAAPLLVAGVIARGAGPLSTAGHAAGAGGGRADFDGDGYADLIVSGTGGSSVIVWGGSRDLSGGTAVPGYGSARQTGDFNGDGQRDLALFQTTVAPGDDPMGTTGAVWHGPVSRAGTLASAVTLDNEDLNYFDVWDAVPGDVDHDGRTDLALSACCGEGTFCTRLYLGSPSGLASTPAGSSPEGREAVAMGDVNGDGYADMVTGNGMDNQITVADGSAGGLTDRTAWQTFMQDTPGVPGADEPEDGFGTSVSVGDVTGDGYADVVGSPGEALGTAQGAGDVTPLHRGPSGLTGDGAQVITQNTTGIPGSPRRATASAAGSGSRTRTATATPTWPQPRTARTTTPVPCGRCTAT